MSASIGIGRREFLGSLGGAAAVTLLGDHAWGQAPFNVGTITITWYPIFLYHLPTVVAIEKGYMREAGVEVKEIIGARGGGETVRNITEGNLFLGEAAAAACVQAILKAKEPLLIVGGGVKSPGDISWVVKQDSPIKTIQDLKGKAMSYTSPGSVTEQLATMSLLRTPGIKPEEVKRIAAGGIAEGLALLRRGEVDAAAMLEPTYSTRATDTRILFYARQVVPEYFQTFWLARRSFLEKNGDVMRRFLRARRKGLEYTLKNVTEAAAIYAKLNKLSDEVGLKVLQASGVPQGDYHSDGRLSPKGLQAVEEAMAISGDIAKEFRIPWKEIVDQSYLDPDQRISLPA